MQNNLNKYLLFTLMLAVFLDVGNFFMPIPIYTPLFLHSQFLLGYPQATKAIMLGYLMACYGFAQLIGGPIFGELSDQYGRKKILTLSLILSVISCLLSGISLTLGSISLIYISRCLLGLSSGTIAVVFAISADYSSNIDRAKNLGYITGSTSLGAVLGPALGGHLASSRFFSWFGYATPFYIMAIPYLINIFLVKIFLPPEQAKSQPKKIYFFAGFYNIYQTIKRSTTLGNLVFMVFLFQMACESFYLSGPIIALEKFHLLPAEIGNHFLIQGIIGIITSIVINKYLSKHFSSIKLFLVNILLLAFSFIFLAITNSSLIFYIPFVGVGLFGTLCWIHSNNLFSQLVSEGEQGFIFGVSQALWAIASVIGPIIVGFITTINYIFSFILPISFGISSFLAAIILIVIMYKKVRNKSNNSYDNI